MNIGLPTTGLGGIFYIVCGLAMPVIEVIKMIIGKSNIKSWKLVGTQAGLTLGVIGMTTLTGVILNILMPVKAKALIPFLDVNQYQEYVYIIYFSPIIFLGSILFVSWIISLLFRLRKHIN